MKMEHIPACRQAGDTEVAGEKCLPVRLTGDFLFCKAE